MYLVKTPEIFRKLMSRSTWKIAGNEKVLYLTFDDGPTPEITPWVMSQLENYSGKATFFCIGKHVKENPEIFKQLVQKGHSIGNHTFDHLNGLKTSNSIYFENIKKCSEVVDSNLFRPPFGLCKPSQYNALKHKFSIILWDVLSWDWEEKNTKENCLKFVLENADAGSVVVFHDSEQALPRLEYTLPRVLSHFSNLGYNFKSIPMLKTDSSF